MKFIYKALFKNILSKNCPNRISRSGDEGKKVNCFTVRLDKNKEPFLLVENFKDNKLIGKKWDGQKFIDNFEVDIKKLEEYELFIIHYYGLATITFDGINDYGWNYFFKYIYIKLWLRNTIQNIDQFFFNKKKIVTDNRLSLLENMLEIQLNKPKSGIGFVDLMCKLYSFKWLYHPNKEIEKRKLKLYLDSLIDSGELIEKNNEYFVTGKAISTLEKYEQSEEKHIREVKHQRKIVLLTVIIAFATLLQTKIINIPTLISFDSSTSKVEKDTVEK